MSGGPRCGRVLIPEWRFVRLRRAQGEEGEMASLLDKAKGLVADKVAMMEKPTADLTDVGIKNVSREALDLKSNVLINNPYDHDLPILEITYRLRCGDR